MFTTTNNGDIGQPCTALPDGGAAGCNAANSEFCLQTGAGTAGICSVQCDPSFGELCPGDSVCRTIDSAGDQDCFADCNVSTEGTSCPTNLSCTPLSPNPADQAVCFPGCTDNASCNVGSPTHLTCSNGVCNCNSDSDCNGGVADAGPGALACDRVSGACYLPCTGSTDYTTCQTGCCGQVGSVDYCNTTASPNRPLCGSCAQNTDCVSATCDVQGFCNVSSDCTADATVCGAPFGDGGMACDTANTQCVCPGEIAQVGLCDACTSPTNCASANCDSQNFCNLPATTLCSQTAGACGSVSGASCDPVTDDCTCPGEAAVTDAGLCVSAPFNPFDNGDIGHACTAAADGTQTGCATNGNESCTAFAQSGVGAGYCTDFCFPAFGLFCPGGSICNQNTNDCSAACLVADGGGCSNGLLCVPQTPNPADPGICAPSACTANTDCNTPGAGTALTCANGVCKCTQNADCNGGAVDAGAGALSCDTASGTCYQPCSSLKACNNSVGGCCESVGSVEYCNPTNGASPATALCGACSQASDCASGFCDAAGRCNVADLCSANPGECEFVGSTCVADSCACGEADAGANGGACYVPVSVLGTSDLSAPCVNLPDAGETGCAAGELCLSVNTLADGGADPTGFCSLDCTESAEICPTGSSCFNLGNTGDCLANCFFETDGGQAGCGNSTSCIGLSPNPADPGACYAAECTTAADCNTQGGTNEICVKGDCLCTADADCAGSNQVCDVPSGQCYSTCADNKQCAIGSGGCCASFGSINYCDFNGLTSLPDAG